MEPPAERQTVAGPPIYIVAKPLIAPHRPLPRVIAAALEAGADGVEFPQEVVPVLMNPDDLEDFPAFLRPLFYSRNSRSLPTARSTTMPFLPVCFRLVRWGASWSPFHLASRRG